MVSLEPHVLCHCLKGGLEGVNVVDVEHQLEVIAESETESELDEVINIYFHQVNNYVNRYLYPRYIWNFVFFLQ